MSLLRAGAGASQILYPPQTWPLDGFGRQAGDLAARVLLLDDGKRTAWVVVDQTSLQPEPLDAVRAIVAERTRTPRDAVLVSVSHTFSAPHLQDSKRLAGTEMDRMRCAEEAVFGAVRSAASEAARTLRPATVAAASTTCDVNVNRDVEVDEGWTLGVNEHGPSDKTAVTVRLDDADGAPIAVLVNYAVQPSVMNESVGPDGTRLATADLAGATVQTVEQACPGAVAFFLIGAAGDQAPAQTAVRTVVAADGVRRRRDAGDAGVLLATCLGERLGNAVVEALPSRGTPAAVRRVQGFLTLPAQRGLPREQISATRSHTYEAAGTRELPYIALSLGPVAVVGVQVELSAETGIAIRDGSPFEHTLVVTMLNGGAKYLPDESAFDRFTYEAQSSQYSRGGAEAMARHVLAQLQVLHGRSTRRTA